MLPIFLSSSRAGIGPRPLAPRAYAPPQKGRPVARPVAAACGLLAVFGLACLGGCGRGTESDLPPLEPVKGAVTVGGQPITAGFVTLQAMDAAKARTLPTSNGQIDASGNYEIMTSGKPGAPVGQYRVMVSPPTIPTKGGAAALPFNQKYADLNRSPLRIEVVASPKAGAYDLKLTK